MSAFNPLFDTILDNDYFTASRFLYKSHHVTKIKLFRRRKLLVSFRLMNNELNHRYTITMAHNVYYLFQELNKWIYKNINHSRCSWNKTKERKEKISSLSSFNRSSPSESFLSRFHSFESALSNLISRWITNGRALPTPFGRRRCILHTTAYYTPAITLRRCLIVGKNSFSTPSLPLAKPPPRSRDFPHFRPFCSVILPRIKLPPSLPRFFPRYNPNTYLTCNEVFITVTWISIRL